MGLIIGASSLSASWQKTEWHGERAWASSADGVLAIVSVERSRLIYLGSEGGETNLLSATVPRPERRSTQDAPNWGGHRFWLGPQKRWVWPQPKDWEYSPAADVRTDGKALVLVHPREDENLPQIERQYEWVEEGLRCAARWKDAKKSWYGMHVVAVPVPMVVSVRLETSEEVPQGLVDVRMSGPIVLGAIPHASVEVVDHGKAKIQSGMARAKWGVVPQPLRINAAKGWQLTVEPQRNLGVEVTSPDHGYLTQVWVDAENSAFAELEQLSPFLETGADGWCESAIIIRAERDDG